MSAAFMHHFTILGVPVSQKNRKQIMRNRKTGKSFIGTEKAVRNWKMFAVQQLKRQWSYPGPMTGEIRADILIFQGSHQSIDADNVLGGVFDAIEKAGIIKNDYQFVEGSWRRDRDRERPRVEVQLTPVGG